MAKLNFDDEYQKLKNKHSANTRRWNKNNPNQKISGVMPKDYNYDSVKYKPSVTNYSLEKTKQKKLNTSAPINKKGDRRNMQRTPKASSSASRSLGDTGYTRTSKGGKNRAGNIVKGTAKQIGGQYLNAAATFNGNVSKGRARREALKAGEVSNRNYGGKNRQFSSGTQSQKERFAKQTKELQKYSNQGRKEVQNAADKLTMSGQKDLDKAKDGLGKAGKFAVDLTSQMGMWGTDAAIGAATGGGILVPMFVRSFGGASQTARQSGANRGQQIAAGLASGGIEVATEKMFSPFEVFKKTAGKGFADNLAERAAYGVVNKLTKDGMPKNALYKAFKGALKAGVGMAEEGSEEAMSDLLQPLYERIYDKDALKQYKTGDYWKGMASDFGMGAAMAGVLGGGGAVINKVSTKGQNNAPYTEQEKKQIIQAAKAQGEDTQAFKYAVSLEEQENGGAELLDAQIDDLAQKTVEEMIDTEKQISSKQQEEEAQMDAMQKVAGNTDGYIGKRMATVEANAVNEIISQRVGAEKNRIADNLVNVFHVEPEAAAVQAESIARIKTGTATAQDLNVASVSNTPARAVIQRELKMQLPATNAETIKVLSNHAGTVRAVQKSKVRETAKQIARAKIYETFTQGMNDETSEVFADGLQNVKDMADAPMYMEAFATYYEGGRVNFNYDNIPIGEQYARFIPEEIRVAAYNAGKQIYLQEQETAKAQQKNVVKSKRRKGTLAMSEKSSKKMGKENSNALRNFVEVTGKNVVVLDSIDYGKRKDVANGKYQDGVIYLSARSNTPIFDVLKHELTHNLQETSPEAYQELKQYVFGKLYESDSEKYNKMILQIKERYARGGVKLTNEQAEDELLSDATDVFFKDYDMIEALVNENRSLGEKLLDGIRSLLDTLHRMAKRADENFEGKPKGDWLEALGIVEEAQKLWVKALNESVGAEVHSQDDAKFNIKSFEFSKQQALENMKSVSEMDVVKSVKEKEFDKKNGKYTDQIKDFFETIKEVENPATGSVALTGRGVKESWGHKGNPNKVGAFKAVPEIIKYGKVIDAQKNWKDRGYDTIVIAAPINIENIPHFSAVVIKRIKSNDVQRYYLHDVLAIEKEQYAKAQDLERTPDSNTAPIISLLQQLNNVNSLTTADIVTGEGKFQLKSPIEETRYSINEKFYDDFDSWIENNSDEERKKSGGYFNVGTVSEPLKSIGMRGEEVRFGKAKIAKIMDDHPEMSKDIIRQIPELLENPIVVMQSKTKLNSVTLLGELKADNGDTVMAAMKLIQSKPNNTVSDFEMITSAYGRSNKNVQELINSSNILYIDENKKRTDKWLTSLRVQFPSDVASYGSIGRIAYIDEKNNSFSKNNAIAEAFEKAKNNTRFQLKDDELKEKQLDIILNSNPANDNYHTWVRSTDDIMSFQEAYDDEEYADDDEFMPDYNRDMATEALESGKITVYSSYPIEPGIFVTPSEMEALSYSGDGYVYRKTVSIEDVAWIEITQGQYAPVTKDDSTMDSDGNQLTDEQAEFFKDSKVRDADGNLLVMYHGTPNAGFTEFNTGTYFTSDEEYADRYHGTGASSLGVKKSADNPDTYKVYLNIRKPFDTRNEEERRIFEEEYFQQWGMGTPLMESGLPDWMDGEDLREFIEEMEYDYDGLILDEGGTGGYGEDVKYRGFSFVTFSPEQVKNVDNENPTDDSDIRYQLKDDTEQLKKKVSSLEELTEQLKSEFKRSKYAKPDPKDTGKAVNKLIEHYLGKRDGVLHASIMQDIEQLYAEMRKTEGNWNLVDDLCRNVAEKIVDKMEIFHDELWQQYTDLRQSLRETTLKLDETYWNDITDFEDMRKAHFGTLKISKKNGVSIDTFYQELTEQYPELFDAAEYTNEVDQLYNIIDTIESLKPYTESYEEGEMAEFADDIAKQVLKMGYDLSQKKTFADIKFEEKEAAVAKVKAERNAMLQKQKERMQNRLDKKDEFYKQKIKDVRKKYKDNKDRKYYTSRIEAYHDWLSDCLLRPTDTKHLPKGYANAVATMLKGFDFGTARSDAYTEKHGPSKRTLRFMELRNLYDKLSDESEEIQIDEEVKERLVRLSTDLDGKRFSELETEQLRDVYRLIKDIRYAMSTINKTFSEGLRENTSTYGNKILKDIEGIKKDNASGAIPAIGDFFRSNTSPWDAFHLMGDTMGELYDNMRKGFDQHVRNTKVAMEFSQQLAKKYKAKEWLDDKAQPKKFDVGGTTIELVPAQVMSLYCLMKREQAVNHIIAGSGIVASPLNRVTSTKAKLTKSLYQKKLDQTHVMPTIDEVNTIIDSLTPEQKTVADEIQKFMSETCADWGNETANKLYGYDKFGEKNYFPIKSSDAFIAESFDARKNPAKIKNVGFTKNVVVNANNPIVLDDIFKVFSDHANTMSMYNALVPAVTDFERVYNYKIKDDSGRQSQSVQKALRQAFGDDAVNYIRTFMNDLNQNHTKNHDHQIANKMIANYKKAKIGANLRVLFQQPTSYVRANAVMNFKYLLGSTYSKKAKLEMFEHCPIAQWKSWGFYNIDVSRDMRDIFLDKKNIVDTAFMDIYGYADDMTWTMIWKSVKKEINATRKDLKVGSDEYWAAVNDRFSYVVDRTQVVDSVFHRSQVMRKDDLFSKITTSFMAEPTKTFNLLRTETILAHREFKDGKKAKATKRMTRVLSTYLVTAAATGAASAIIDALRGASPDDDDKDFYERWVSYVGQDFADNVNPANLLPGLRDIYSLMQGFDVSRMDMAGFTDLYKSFQYWQSESATTYFALKKTVGGISSVTGLPIGSLWRDVESCAEAFAKLFFPEEKVDLVMTQLRYDMASSKNRSKYAALYARTYDKGNTSGASMIEREVVSSGTDEKKFSQSVETQQTNLAASKAAKILNRGLKGDTAEAQKLVRSYCSKYGLKYEKVWAKALEESQKNRKLYQKAYDATIAKLSEQ